MLDQFYSCIRALNAKPELLDELDTDKSKALMDSLGNVKCAMAAPDQDLEMAMTEFINIFDSYELNDVIAGLPSLRGMLPKSETAYPRQIINDITIMTLERFTQ